MTDEAAVEARKARATKRFFDGIVRDVAVQTEAISRSRARVRDQFPDEHVIFAPGGTSVVALPTNIALIQAGIARRFVIASYDRPGSLGDHIGQALCAYAREQGVEVEWVQGDAIIAGKDDPTLPAAIVEALVRLGAERGGVSLNESIAFGIPKPPPDADPMNVGDLLSEGRIRRRKLDPASERERAMTHDNMGVNPGLYRSELQRLGFLRPESFGLSYSWWGSPPNYGIVHEAKRILEDDAGAWFDAHKDTLGRHRVVMQPATPSPALGAITLGPLMAVLSLEVRAEAGDTLTFSDMGNIQLLAALDPEFEHPWLDRDGVLIRLDRSELEGWPWVQEQMARFESLVPMDLRGRMSPAASSELLTSGMGWPADWRKTLDAMVIFDETATEIAPTVEASESIGDFILSAAPTPGPGLSLGLLGGYPQLEALAWTAQPEGAGTSLRLVSDEVVQAGALRSNAVFELTTSITDEGQLHRELRDAQGHVASGTTITAWGAAADVSAEVPSGQELATITVGSHGLYADFAEPLGHLRPYRFTFPVVLEQIATLAAAEDALAAEDSVGAARWKVTFHAGTQPGDTLRITRRDGAGAEIDVARQTGESQQLVLSLVRQPLA